MLVKTCNEKKLGEITPFVSAKYQPGIKVQAFS